MDICKICHKDLNENPHSPECPDIDTEGIQYYDSITPSLSDEDYNRMMNEYYDSMEELYDEID